MRFKNNALGYGDETLEEAVGRVLKKRGKTIAVAESCTGGLISSRITDVRGSSKYFLDGVIAYSDISKENLLGVSRGTLKYYGSVSKQVALEMAKGVKHFSCADIGLAVTGIAGPTGGTRAKPVGLVYIALVTDRKSLVKEFRFKGSRQMIKFQASQVALDLLRQRV
ncbi:MAG: nicotinamide-nucleotide amidohydrolase family protein [Candidatus Omnitrophica bacterium]|nr:nicotinamide-nucleotide amidohydrolase family protein [Candidatus Omnitrophota bacterium]